MEIKENKFKVIIKTKAIKNSFEGYDENKKAYKINIKAKPIEGEANKELIKFFSKELNKKIRIVSGFVIKHGTNPLGMTFAQVTGKKDYERDQILNVFGREGYERLGEIGPNNGKTKPVLLARINKPTFYWQ